MLARSFIQENGFTETRTSSAPRALSQAVKNLKEVVGTNVPLQSRLQGLKNYGLKSLMSREAAAPVISVKQALGREVKDRVMQEAVEVLDADALEKMSGAERDRYLQKK